MNPPASTAATAFIWNRGGWFGGQLGCTVWLLFPAVGLPRQSVLIWLSLGSFVALNAWGLYLWRRRFSLSAYAGIQRFLLAASVIVALVVLTFRANGVAEPYWIIALAPALMLVCSMRERQVRQAHQ